MAIIVQNTQTLIKPDVYDILGPDYDHTTAPIYNRAQKGPDAPDATLFQFPFRKPVSPDNTGNPEGVQWNASNASSKRNAKLLYGRMHHKKTTFGVGEVAEGNQTYGNNQASTFEEEMDLHLEYQINSAERIIIGEQEANPGNGTDNFQTRGLELQVLDTARIALQTDSATQVPEAYRPLAAQVPTLTISGGDYTLSEDTLMDPLAAIWSVLKKKLDLDLYATSVFKRKVSAMGRFVPADAAQTVIRRFNQSANDKRMETRIDTYYGDCGTVRLEMHPFMRQDTTQKAEALGVDMRFLKLRVRKAPSTIELKPEGSGRRGETEQTFGLQAIPTYMAQFRRDD